ncbi:hypothetical protein ABZ816_01570 [Actinosynnema sp. NPDC047251]|uniref:Uncharacterized protein n=1 Tax=Saccharothrix espanaensis (strain ATCC 51144 / DSM 44229 / JCM 9112 / NBRC 15066 / NRRL 15764) TaxID=1179773 RepID=K0JT40_SACES|nr:hypothetical protein [Saccharothrix espanaensis]CCH30940.1 hypothetical protein BN6_36450 [Saccharothrix espanaensis DSM 44229]
MTTGARATVGAASPRGLLIDRAWSRLGDAVAPLGNGSGRPLARTVKLVLDPLVLRPVLHPEFAAGAVAAEHADALVDRIVAAGPVLAATAAWFLVLKKARRRAGITDGNPQDLYFQRCYELATVHGDPRLSPNAAERAGAVLAEVHDQDGPTVAGLRGFVTDPANAPELTRLLDAAWSAAPDPVEPGTTSPGDFLATCATDPDPALFDALVAQRAGTRGAADLAEPGAARAHGLSDRDRPDRPVLGGTAAKQSLPKPFDRSIVERLFVPLTTAHRDALADVPALVRQEIARSAGPWQLADEAGRVVLVLGREAVAGLAGDVTGDAAARLRGRWEREAYVRRAQRMPSAVPESVRADVRGVREAYLRRLWVRTHGRELRRETVPADGLWDVLDGVLRSVILDQRDRLRSALERRAAG